MSDASLPPVDSRDTGAGAATAPARPVLAGTNEAAVANIASMVRVGDASTADTVKVGTAAVADMTAAKRKNAINMLWEVTQAAIAIFLTVAAIVAAFMFRGASTDPVPSTLTNALFIVLGFYYGRTNHSRPTPSMPLGEEGSRMPGTRE